LSSARADSGAIAPANMIVKTHHGIGRIGSVLS
jgi:hypothetical protein